MDVMAWLFTMASIFAASVSLYVVLFRNQELYSEFLESAKVHGAESMRAHLRLSTLVAWSIVLWGFWLVVMLRERHEAFAFAWAVILVLSACDLLYVVRAPQTRLADLANAQSFRELQAWPYRLWRVVSDGMMIAGCILALAH